MGVSSQFSGFRCQVSGKSKTSSLLEMAIAAKVWSLEVGDERLELATWRLLAGCSLSWGLELRCLFWRGEADFYLLVGFVGGWFPLPLANCVGGGLGEDGMASFYFDCFDGAVRGD